ncbi:MAG: DOMON-like domain-containing protein [Sphingopyxis sp.]
MTSPPNPDYPEPVEGLSLICHPDTPSQTVTGVKVQISRQVHTGALWIEYEVAGAKHLVLPKAQNPIRADNLWMTTCFELFVRTLGHVGYFEYNFSPSCRWAAYSFDAYRSAMRELPMHDPEIWLTTMEDYFFLAVEAGPELAMKEIGIALSAVIEEVDGTKSYWALRHPPGPPDFHHPDCFALNLGAPDAV